MKWFALFTLGCFCTLAAHSIEKYHPDVNREQSDLSAFVAQKLEEYDSRTAEVTLWKATPLERIVLQANGHGVPDRATSHANEIRERCGEDFACLLAWAERRRK